MQWVDSCWSAGIVRGEILGYCAMADDAKPTDDDAEAVPDKPAPEKKGPKMVGGDLSNLQGAEVDHSSPLARISGLSLDPNAPRAQPEPEPKPEPKPEPAAEPEPEATADDKPVRTRIAIPAPPDPTLPAVPQEARPKEEETLGDLRAEIAAEVARSKKERETQTAMESMEDEDEGETKKKSGPLRWLKRVVLVLVVGGFLAGAGIVLAGYIYVRRQTARAQTEDMAQAVVNEDMATIGFIATMAPERLNRMVTFEEGGLEKTYTPLGLASLRGQAKVALELLKQGAKPDLRDDRKNVPIHYAARNGHENTIKVLVTKGQADLEIRGQGNRTPLHMAVDHGQAETVALLLELGAEVNSKDYMQATPLHHAAENGYVETAEFLLDGGADVGARDETGKIPLHYATTAEMADMLIVAKSDPNAPDGYGLTPLHQAARSGNTDVARVLLEAGAEINARTKGGETPLDMADKTIIYFLQGRGAESGQAQ